MADLSPTAEALRDIMHVAATAKGKSGRKAALKKIYEDAEETLVELLADPFPTRLDD